MSYSYSKRLRSARTKILNITSSIVLLGSSLGTAVPMFLSQQATALSSGPLVINEVSSNSSPEWVELYNKSASPVDISGWYIKDAANNNFGSPVPTSTSVPAHGYYAVDETGTVLNNTGDSVTLYNASNTLEDHMNFPALSAGQTYGRSGAGGTSVGPLFGSSKGFANPLFSNTAVYNQSQQFWYDNLTDAVALANANDTLIVHGNETITNTISISVPLTIKGISGATINTSGSHTLFNITAANTELYGLSFVKTDKTSQDILTILANNVRIWGNHFTGQFNIGDGEVSRAMVIGYVTGVDILNNFIQDLRQPAYIDGASGNVFNNYVAGTKGWVIVSESKLDFKGNSWGTGNSQNAVDIAIIKDSPVGPDNYLANLMHMSDVNHYAVIEDQTPTSPVMTDVFVNASAATGGNGYPVAPYQTITPALTRIIEGGRVHIANGNYSEGLNIVKNGTQLIGESPAGVQVTASHATIFGQGVSVNGLRDVSISNMTFNAPAGSPISYHFQAYKSSKLSLSNLTFNGPGKTSSPKIGGVDFNSVDGVAIDNVTAQNYSKNGFSFTSEYVSGDPYTRNVKLSNITANNNNWAGIAFYTVGNDHSPAYVGGTHNITGVTFAGNNVVSNNTKGIQVEGDSDANEGIGATPRWGISGPGSSAVDLGNTAFSGNIFDIINYQKNGLLALNSTFNGKTGDQMTATERTTEDGLIYDKNDLSALGLVKYYQLPTVPTNGQPNGGYEKTNDFYFTWDTSTGDSPITYEFQSSLNPASANGILTTGVWDNILNGDSQQKNLTSPTIHSKGAPDGVWYWQVRAIDANGNKSAWSPIWSVTIDTHAPTANFIFPTPGPAAKSFQVKFNEPVNPTDATNSANYFLNNWPDAPSFLSLAGHATVTYDSLTDTSTVTFTSAGWYVSPEQQWGVSDVHDLAGNLLSPNPTTAYSTPMIKPSTPGTPTTTSPTSNKNVVWTWTAATDPGGVNASGIKGYNYWLTSPTSITPYTTKFTTDKTVTTTVSTDGTYTLHVQAVDNAGNTSLESTGSVVVDTALPVIKDNFNVRMLTGDKLTLNPAVSDSLPVTYQWKVSDSKLLNNPHDTLDGISLAIGPAPKGDYTVMLTVTDAAGNATTKTYNVTIANTGSDNNASTPNNAVLGDSTTNPQKTETGDTNNGNTGGNVLGDSTTTPSTTTTPTTTSNGQVKGDSTSGNTNKSVSTNNNSNFLGLGWWWLLVLGVLLSFFWFVFGRANSDNKA